MKTGVHFKSVDGCELSSTDAAKEVLAEAIGDHPNFLSAATAALKEKDWRHGYPKHFAIAMQEAAQSPQAAVEQAQRALDAFASKFEFRAENGQVTPLHEAVRAGVASGKSCFASVTIDGCEGAMPPKFCLPYNGKHLEGAAIVRQAQAWLSAGIIEASAARTLEMLATREEVFDQRGHNYCVLGAGSAMGPTLNLLAQGATVYAVDVPNPKIWSQLILAARKSPGKLVVPVAGGSEKVESLRDDKALALAAGCDILRQAPDVAAWCASCALGSPLTLGTYVYLDGALFARVAAACDAIAAAVGEARGGADQVDGVKFAHLLSPTEVHVVPKETTAAAQKRYSKITPHMLWEQPLRVLSREKVLKPNFSVLIPQSGPESPLHIMDCLVRMQGPNYALAKSLQKWRAVLARSQGHVCSANVGPATLTESITHNRLVAAGLIGSGYFGVEPFQVPTTKALMTALLLWDLQAAPGESAAHPETSLQNPLELFAENCCHGGLWRSPYTPDTCAEVSALVFVADKAKIGLLAGAGAFSVALALRAQRSKL